MNKMSTHSTVGRSSSGNTERDENNVAIDCVYVSAVEWDTCQKAKIVRHRIRSHTVMNLMESARHQLYASFSSFLTHILRTALHDPSKSAN